MIEGIAVVIDKGSVQEAIDAADQRYHEKNGLPPTHVCLPGHIDRTQLNTYTLVIGPSTSQGRTRTRHTGTVIVGRLVGAPVRRDGWQQLRLVDEPAQADGWQQLELC